MWGKCVCDLWPAGPQQWLVQQVWTVCGSDHKDPGRRVQSVELGQQLGHDPVQRDSIKKAARGMKGRRSHRRVSAGNTHLSITPPESPLRPLLGARESNSSKKTTHGAAERALQNTAHNDIFIRHVNILKLQVLIKHNNHRGWFLCYIITVFSFKLWWLTLEQRFP